MGIGIINCFMIVLTFMAIPFLAHGYSAFDSRAKDINSHQLKHMKQTDLNSNNYPSIISSYH
jgi:hypothetical protein